MATVLEVRQALADHGYVPIPLIGKKPPFEKWQKIENVSRSMLEAWGRNWSRATNTGILTRLTPTIDIDILNEPAAIAAEALARERFEERGYFLVRIGRAPKRAIPFRTLQSFAKLTANFAVPAGADAEKIEFLCDGQQFVAHGIHPDTQKPYSWFGGDPTTIGYDELPYISAEEAEQLQRDIVALLIRDFGYVVAPGRPARKGNGTPDDRAKDWQQLVNDILAGNDLHANTRDLAAKMVRAGTDGGSVVNFLRGLMDSSAAPRDERWQSRYDNLPRQVDSIEEKLERERAAAAPTPAPAGGAPPPSSPPPSSPNIGPTPSATPGPTPAARSLLTVHKIFQKWLGQEYDTTVLDAVLATAAAEQLPGDPAWLMIISGPGNAKTETAQSVSAISGAHIVSTITSEGALLSATPKKGRSRAATGGLLRAIGNRGILVIKDFTSILSMERNVRSALMAALREIHDGRWVRNVGTDGGQTLSWIGRIVVVAACTTAWDQAHAVIATMGDRFVLVRSNSHKGRTEAGTKAIRNTGDEIRMRQEMATAVAGLLANLKTADAKLTDDEVQRILEVADIVTLARTGVETDYRGDVIDAHAPEMPTRFAKQLVQIMRGALALDMTRWEALALVVRCARDSIPQLRLAVLDDLKEHGASEAGDVRKRLQKPRRTISRILEALHALGLVICTETRITKASGAEVTIRKYRLTTDTANALPALTP